MLRKQKKIILKVSKFYSNMTSLLFLTEIIQTPYNVSFSILRGKLTEIGICQNIQQYDVQMTSNYVFLFIKLSLKPGFHMIVLIVPIVPDVSKYFETIRTTGAIGSFHMIVSIASKARDAWSSAMSLGQTIEFLRVFCKQAT